MIDEYLELKERYYKIKYLLYEKGTNLTLIVDIGKTITEIKKIVKEDLINEI